VVWEVAKFVPRYRELKQAVADGDLQARTRIYNEAIIFEWVSAFLALAALGFNWSKLNPKALALEGTWLLQHVAHISQADNGFQTGMTGGIAAGLVLGTVVLIIARLRSNRRPSKPARVAGLGRLRKVLPDFSALIPTAMRERLLWVVVAVSAGICEEIVFRGWLLSTLHGELKVSGMGLILVAAAVFGFAHAYQGVAGVILTAFAGLVFCGLYVVTGSLLWPIVLHILIDLRFALLPAPRVPHSREAFA
jgi:membrane protease YdiL (CAAX protease family)